MQKKIKKIKFFCIIYKNYIVILLKKEIKFFEELSNNYFAYRIHVAKVQCST